LHEWFIAEDRPVPRFLVLDQPSQVYFPPDSVEAEPASNEDRIALGRLIRQLEAFVAARDDFQVILTDHADLQEPWFRDAVVERWRGGQAFVPTSWIEG
jgi:hypothetical protein